MGREPERGAARTFAANEPPLPGKAEGFPDDFKRLPRAPPVDGKFIIEDMQRIGPPDSHRLSAATGWMELGNRAEALAELDAISPDNQQHPFVLDVRWMLLAEGNQWEAALDIAEKLVSCAPDIAAGWLHRAYALRRVPQGGLEKAWHALRPAADKFPKESTVFYNLSCYACQMNKLDDARQWFRRAIKAGEKEHIKRMALADSDLEPMWGEIRAL
jgi:tetratricopeptide (TPR) repeat protein